jgi:SAM-dependent methyltransferase
MTESSRATWEAHADEWVAWARTPGHDCFYWDYNEPAFLELVPPPGGLTLEVGCGEGRVARTLTRAGHRVLAVDGSPTLARSAAAESPGVEVLEADATALPVRSGAADVVVSFMVLMDIEDLGACVRELARVLAPQGVLCAAIMHPIMSAGMFVPEDPNGTFALGEYQRPMHHTLRFERGDLAMTFNFEHRPLEAYSRALEDAGLVITALREPAPREAAVARYPELANARRVPGFLHLTARHSPA